MKNILLALSLTFTVSTFGQGSVPLPKLTGTKPAYGVYAGNPYAVRQTHQGPRLSTSARRQARMFLRAPACWAAGSLPILTNNQNRPKNSLGQPIWHWNDMGKRIQIEGHEDFFEVIVYNLKRQRNEIPDYYKNITMKHVHVIRYGPVVNPKVHQGSYAWGNRGHIVIGSRTWYQDKWDCTSMILLHEIQHCNMDSKYNSHPGADWAAYYLGKKMNLSPYYRNWFKSLDLRRGFSQAKWDDQYNWKR